MTLQTLVDGIKRDARLGTSGNNSDQAASDIIRWLNNRRFEFWRAHPWDYSLADISLTVTSSDYDKTLDSTIGEIIDMGIVGQTGSLRSYGMKEYRNWKKRQNVSDTGVVRGYVKIGRSAAGDLKVRFFDAPADSTSIEGWGKKRISAYTTSDISTVTTLEYFPSEAQDVLYRGVLGDAYDQMGDIRAERTTRSFYAGIKNLKGEVDSEADDVPTSPPPDFIRFSRRKRGGSTVV